MSKLFAAALMIVLVLGGAGSAENLEADVVIVGGGGAGLVAAIEAAVHGANVILIEKLSFLGGETLISGGGLQAAGSSVQEAKGIEDSADALYKYWMEKGLYRINADKASLIANESAAHIEWLQEQGVEMTPETLSPGSWSPAEPQRFHRAVGGGAGLIQPLIKSAESLGVQFYTDTEGTELIMENGRVVGVKTEGSVSEVRANAVIITTGGFGANKDLLAQYAPDYVDVVGVTTPGNMGGGLLMAEAVGAKISGLHGAIGWFSTPVGLSPTIYVNMQGERFMDETIFYALKAEALIQQGGMAYDVFDQAFVDGLAENTQNNISGAVDDGRIIQADSLTALAEALGVPADALTATVDTFNKSVEAGKDLAYHRNPASLRTVAAGPFYAMPVYLSHLGSIGGVVTNLEAQVINDKDQVIPGLYAAGSVTGGFLGDVYPGSGTAIAQLVVMGRIAGANAADE